MVFSTRILGGLAAERMRHGFWASVTAAAMLTGCGQKGPLFLPAPRQAQKAVATTPAATTLAAPASAAH
jgi:predicted small lipoprotein YifL